MGCDIYSFVEQRDHHDTRWQVPPEWPLVDPDDFDSFRPEHGPNGGPFGDRRYGVFGFLGYSERNHSLVPALAPLRGLPADLSAAVARQARERKADAHSHSWLSVPELAGFDYTQPFEDRRTSQYVGGVLDGGATSEPGLGTSTTFREFLGDQFFVDLAKLTALNATRPTRVVFWFA